MPNFCIENNCQKRAIYNFIKETSPVYCSIHKLETMVDVYNKKCEETDC